jgi:hypothetical protein
MTKTLAAAAVDLYFRRLKTTTKTITAAAVDLYRRRRIKTYDQDILSPLP